jgi:hypothetical protein
MLDDLDELDRLNAEAAAKASAKAGAKNRGRKYGSLIVLGTKDLDTAAPREYLIKGLMSSAEISIWVGPPKCGKSFLLLYISYMLSLGRSVFGRRVKQISVLYVAAEGEGGIANRIRALRDRYGDSPNFHFIAQPADLLHRTGHLEDLKLAAAAVGAQLIVLDTLSRLMSGGDENAPGDMGTFIKNVGELRHETQAHISIVHHGTKSSNGSTPRGHSSLTGADDALIEVIKLDDGTRTATVIHAKDDADGDRFGFKLSRVELGTDPDGDAIATLIVDEMAEPAAASAQAPSLSSNEKIAVRCFDSAFKADAITATVGPGFDERLVVRVGDWRRWFYQEGKPGEDANTKRMAFNRARDALLAKGCIAAENDFVWPVKRP